MRGKGMNEESIPFTVGRQVQMLKSTERNLGIELFRCVLMFLIVLGHCYGHGIFARDRGCWTLVYTALIMWHVDGFVAISGWFGVKWSLKKFMKLYGMFFFYSCLSFLYIYCFRGGSIKSFRVSSGWFGGTYVMLMMVSPLLNLCLAHLVDLPRKKIFEVWGLFALSLFLTWVPLNMFTGVDAAGASGYSIVLFVFIYVSMRLMRMLDVSVTKRLVIGGVILYFGVQFLLGALKCGLHLIRYGEISWNCFRFLCSYNAPHVLLMAFAMMFLFGKYMRVPACIGPALNFIAPSMFGIYLCHDTTAFGPLMYCIPETFLRENSLMHPSLIVLICGALTFIFCLGVDIARRALFALVGLGYYKIQSGTRK